MQTGQLVPTLQSGLPWFILGCHVESELDVQEQEVNTGQTGILL